MKIGAHEVNGGTWTSVVFDTERVTIAEIARVPAGRPVLRTCESFARAASEVDTLRRLKSARRLARKRCTTLLAEGRYQLLQVDPPANAAQLSPDELRAAMRWRIKEMVDFPVEAAGIDVIEVPPSGNRGAQLWVAAASHDVLRPCIQQFQEAGIELAAIDLPELAQRNLASLFEEPNRGLAFLSFTPQSGQLIITYGGELYMVRHIDTGAAALTGPDDEALFERVLLDIQRSLDSFDRNYGAIGLVRLLVGPLPHGEKFLAYLASNLALPVASARLDAVMDLTQTPHLDNIAAQADAWLALGAALRD